MLLLHFFINLSNLFKIIQAVLVIVVVLSFYQVAMHYDGPGISFRNLYQIVE